MSGEEKPAVGIDLELLEDEIRITTPDRVVSVPRRPIHVVEGLRFGPGDTLVVTFPAAEKERVEEIKRELDAAMPGVTVVVVVGGRIAKVDAPPEETEPPPRQIVDNVFGPAGDRG